MEAERKTFAHDLKKNVRRRLVTGLLVEFPRAGMKVISFVTGGTKCKDGTELTSIFIPTTPNPISPVISLVYPLMFSLHISSVIRW